MAVAHFLLTCVLLLRFSIQVAKTSERKCLNTTTGHRRVCLYHGTLNWTNAGEFCEKNGGILAVDNDTSMHAILESLLKNESPDDIAWIGGRTVPLYWSWILSDGSPQKMYFQGCYNKTDKVNMEEACAAVENVGQCEKKCELYGYYSLHKMASRKTNLPSCCCGRRLGDTYSTECSKNGCLNGKYFCGTKETARAWYAARTKLKLIEWSIWKPPSSNLPNESLCGAIYRNKQGKLVMVFDSCISEKPSVCSAGRKIGNICKSGEKYIREKNSTTCLKLVITPKQWEGASRLCHTTIQGRRGQSMAALTSIQVFQALADYFGDLKSLGKATYWISSTNNVWVWFTGHRNHTSEDIVTSHWEDKNSREPSSDQCLAISRKGKWTAQYCNFDIQKRESVKYYICEYATRAESTTHTENRYSATADPHRFKTTTSIGSSDVSTDPHRFKTTTSIGSSDVSTDAHGHKTTNTASSYVSTGLPVTPLR